MLLTYEAASGQVQLVPARSHPDSSAVGADQAGLALGVLGQEGHHPLHWPPAGRGHALRSLQQSLKQAALVEDHVVRDTDLERKRHSETSWQLDRTVPYSDSAHLPPVVVVPLRSRGAHPRPEPQTTTGIQCPGRPALSQGYTHQLQTLGLTGQTHRTQCLHDSSYKIKVRF